MQSTMLISDIPVVVEQKKIKNMYIHVLPPNGDVRVTVPCKTAQDTIRLFVISRIAWIKRQRSAMKKQSRQTKREYISGETHFLWGNSYRLEVVYSNQKNDVFIKDKRIFLQVRKNSTPEQRGKIMEEWYRKQLKDAIPDVLEKCVKRTKIRPDEWCIKNMRTCWGTCNIDKKRIWLNLQLAKKTPECLEYVIIHELTHLYERKHNDVFQSYMDDFYPNWRTVRQTLNSQMLDWIGC